MRKMSTLHLARRCLVHGRQYCSSTAPVPAVTRKPFPLFTGALYVGTLSTVLAAWLDERLDLRKWKRVQYCITSAGTGEPIELSLRARTRPPPIGAMEWPGGRILLQWALDEGGLGRDSGTVVTIGEGIGVTSIGLAVLRTRHGDDADGGSPGIIATDYCDESLELLRSNAAGHGICKERMAIRKWDAAAGEAALAALPVPIEQVSHVIGSDVVYHGFGVDTDPSGRGLERTLKALLTAKPSLKVRLMVSDRFSGGAVAALSEAAGVNASTRVSTAVDPAVAAFERECERLGLAVRKEQMPAPVLARVWASQGPAARLYWWLAGFYDGISMYTIELEGNNMKK